LSTMKKFPFSFVVISSASKSNVNVDGVGLLTEYVQKSPNGVSAPSGGKETTFVPMVIAFTGDLTKTDKPASGRLGSNLTINCTALFGTKIPELKVECAFSTKPSACVTESFVGL